MPDWHGFEDEDEDDRTPTQLANADHAVESDGGWKCDICGLPVNGHPSDGDAVYHVEP